jgi:hypothetical protein
MWILLWKDSEWKQLSNIWINTWRHLKNYEWNIVIRTSDEISWGSGWKLQLLTMVRFSIIVLFLTLLVTIDAAAVRGRTGSGMRKTVMQQRNLKRVTFGIVLPYSTFRQRKYNSTVLATLGTYYRARPQHPLTKKYNISYNIAMVGRKPSPTRKYYMNVHIN